MIKMQMIGRLGRDCTTNQVNGKSVINFTVAHSEKFKDNQGVLKEKTLWVDCAYWTDRVAVAPYLRKGTQVYVEGAPDVKSFQKNDGTPGVGLTLRVFSVQLLGSAQDSNSGAFAPANESSSQSERVPSASDITEPIDDLPF